MSTQIINMRKWSVCRKLRILVFIQWEYR